MVKERIRWIDMAKGIGILLVMIGHLGLPYAKTWIYTFHIPLFFMLSGCVFRGYDKDFKSFFIKKLKSIVVPYFCLGIFLPIFFSIQSYFIDKERNITVYINFFVDFLIQKRWFTIWFIACLFIVEILFFFIVKLCKNNMKPIVIVSCILAAVSMAYFKLGGPALPWNIDIAFSALPFFAGGYYLFNNKTIYEFFLEKRPVKFLVFLALAILNVGCAYATLRISNELLDMSSGLWGFPPLTYIAAFAGSLCVIMFSNFIIIKPIEYIGKNSLVYYAWHSRIMIPILGYVYTALGIFQTKSLIEQCLYCFVSLVVICVILTIPDYIIRHSKLKFMVGVF